MPMDKIMTTKTQTMNNLYRIGAVARLTGIPADTLRIWERRYDVVKPQRTEKGGRLYSQDDVTRLTLIKTLVDQGHAISTVANLHIDELTQRLGSLTALSRPQAPEGQQNICLVGEAISIRASAGVSMPANLALAGIYPNIAGFLEDNEVHCDTLVIELPFLDKSTVSIVSDPGLSSRCQQIVLIYAFSPTNVLKQLQRLQIITERAPVDLEEIWRLCSSQQHKPIDLTPTDFHPDSVSTEPVPKRLFTASELAALSQITTTLKCECPHHMSAIIETLVAFEQYSTQCENDSTQDAALHSYLHVMTAKARWLMETALKKLAEVERIDVAALTDDQT